ncbi:MAG: DUF4396 domain-containing protein [Pseudomonadales bacterium]|jgi:hypothetical protein|nr:DUF4396 domain-containing protein [Pseudomonadales bacterium]MDP6469809.1 DUF4396 domain-containing protein [Pseudomonadales bacterium]MDP6827589.1 DUF4396 domain-containing protein [Pseudomonadales bacterium]MDP6971279.1 DUF4396 domain-containing protein [Pseudomonadales bacterium]|tara:strand:- start:4036 stop:4491 length:456 start_codon:yes stop_codon:yes gene_type:complete
MSETCEHSTHPGNPFVTSAQATMHCLTGCVIGEVAGLMIATTLGFAVWPTVILATSCAYLSGFTLGLLPVMRDQGKSFAEALRLIWIGEAVSIGVMEVAMNFADFAAGGMDATSVLSTPFWIGVAVAVPAGFVAAWPVNWWLLKRDLKACH